MRFHAVILILLFSTGILANGDGCPFDQISPSHHLGVEFEAAIELASMQQFNPTLKKKQKRAAIDGLIRETVRLLEAAGYETEIVRGLHHDRDVVAIRRDRTKDGIDLYHYLNTHWNVDLVFDPHSWGQKKSPEESQTYSFEHANGRSFIEIPTIEIRDMARGEPDTHLLFHEALHAYTNRLFRSGVAGLLHGEFYSRGNRKFGVEGYEGYISLDEAAAYAFDARRSRRDTGSSLHFRDRFGLLAEIQQELTSLTGELQKASPNATVSLGLGTDGWNREGSDPVVVRLETSEFRFVFPVPTQILSRIPNSPTEQQRVARSLVIQKAASLKAFLEEGNQLIHQIEKQGYGDANTLNNLTTLDFEARNGITQDWEVPQ